MKVHLQNTKQILDAVYDFELDAIRTVPHQNQEFAIAISHKDNDSASVNAVQDVVAEGTHSCAGMRRMCVYASGNVVVLLSPSQEGEDFVQVLQRTELGASPIIEICATRIRVEGSAKVVLQG